MAVVFMKQSCGKEVPIFRSALQRHTWPITPHQPYRFLNAGV